MYVVLTQWIGILNNLFFFVSRSPLIFFKLPLKACSETSEEEKEKFSITYPGWLAAGKM